MPSASGQGLASPGHVQRRREPALDVDSRWSKFMNKSLLIALVLAASGLLVGCVNPDDLNNVAPTSSTVKGASNPK